MPSWAPTQSQRAAEALREEHKAEARAHFRTPLVFSVHEAKGMEYEGVILFRLLSSERRTFAELAEGVTEEDLTRESLEYRRARDKGNRSLEAYKFYVNALYVALIRAVLNVWRMVDAPSHPLLAHLPVTFGEAAGGPALQRSTPGCYCAPPAPGARRRGSRCSRCWGCPGSSPNSGQTRRGGCSRPLTRGVDEANKKDVTRRQWLELARACQLPPRAAERVLRETAEVRETAEALVTRSFLPPGMKEACRALLQERTELLLGEANR